MRLPNVIRQLLDPLTERIPVPILGGVNRGRWWNLASSGSGYATGRRAHEQMSVLEQLIRPGEVVWDVGAHHGCVTLLAAARVQPHGWVYAFEPGKQNNRILRRHVRWNRLQNVTVEDRALAAYTGVARFGGGTTSKMHALGGGDDEVAVATGVSLVQAGAVRAPTFVKIDVEGAEGDVLEGALPVLPSSALILLAVHSATADQACTRLLREQGFTLLPSPALVRARSGTWLGDPDLLCIGPDYQDDGRIARLCERTRFIADRVSASARPQRGAWA
jgi:FkbM family methyltransferase